MCKPNCSRCCEFMIVNISENVSADYKIWAEYHNGISVIDIEGIKFLKIDTQCSKLKDGKCSIHEFKPLLCKTYDCEAPGYEAFKHLL